MKLIKTITEEIHAELDELREDLGVPIAAGLGEITNYAVRECNGANGKFKMVDIFVTANKNKVYRKSFSVDFARKFFNQLGYKVRECIGAKVFITVKKPYNNVGYMSFIVEDDGELNVWKYQEFSEDADKQLDELGL